MAAIIRAPALAGGSRQLRRPGAIPVAEAVAVAPAQAPVEPVLAPAAPAPQEVLRRIELQAGQLREREAAAQAVQDELALQREQMAHQQQQLAQQQAELAAREQALQAAQQRLQDEAEEVRAEAGRRGHQQGLEQGEREAGAAVATQVERLNAVTQALTQSRRAALEEQQDLLVETAFTAVCRVLGTQAASRAGMESMVRSLTDGAHGPESLVVRVHPLDLPLMQGGALDPRLAFQGDAGVELGGCIVDGPRGTLDARLELQLQHLRETLMQVRRQHTQLEAPV